nr:iron chelate uptake ABC transporter family permease subunit [Exiguobacterium sp. s189]
MMQPAIEQIRQGRMKRRRRYVGMTTLLAFVAVMLSGLMLMLGNTIYPVQDVIRVLLGEDVQGATFAVEVLRLPRMLAGVFAGAAFGAAGTIFQTMLRNPLANPNVIGITTGSSAAAVFCIVVLQTSEAVISIASIIGGLVTVLVIYFLSKGASFSIGRLVLVGIGIQAMLTAVINYLLLISRQNDVAMAMRWLTGSLNGAKLEELPPLIITVLICLPIVLLLTRQLEMLELGEMAATGLGINTNQTRLLLIVAAVFMLALATATTGPIAFIAFLAGPIAKRLVGTSHAGILPAALVGIILVLASDLVGQFAFTARYPVGVITGIIGAPYLLYLLIRMNQKGDF